MRTTIDMPDALFRKTKAVAALRGSSMKELIIRAVEREVIVKFPASQAETSETTPYPLLERPQARSNRLRFR